MEKNDYNLILTALLIVLVGFAYYNLQSSKIQVSSLFNSEIEDQEAKNLYNLYKTKKLMKKIRAQKEQQISDNDTVSIMLKELNSTNIDEMEKDFQEVDNDLNSL